MLQQNSVRFLFKRTEDQFKIGLRSVINLGRQFMFHLYL